MVCADCNTNKFGYSSTFPPLACLCYTSPCALSSYVDEQAYIPQEVDGECRNYEVTPLNSLSGTSCSLTCYRFSMQRQHAKPVAQPQSPLIDDSDFVSRCFSPSNPLQPAVLIRFYDLPLSSYSNLPIIDHPPTYPGRWKLPRSGSQ